MEDELYRFGKILESNHELKQALSDKSIDKTQRIKVLDELLADKVSAAHVGAPDVHRGPGPGSSVAEDPRPS